MNTDAGRVSMEAVSADLASITEAATGRLNTRLDHAAGAEERITQTFVVGSIIAAIAFLAGAFLLGRAYRETASSKQMLQATLDSVREGVGAVDYRGHLRAWNSSLLAMLGVGGDNIRQGVPLSEAIASAGKLGRRVYESRGLCCQPHLPESYRGLAGTLAGA